MHRRWRAAAVVGVVLGAIAAGCGGGGGGGGRPSSRVTVVAPAPFAQESLALVVNDTTGALVSSSAVGGSAGNAVVVPPGGSVTLAAAVGTTSFAWTTVVDPPDGTITFANPLFTPAPTPASVQTWNVTLSGTPANTSHFVVLGPCGQQYSTTTTTSAIVISDANCTAISSARVLALAYSPGNQLTGWHETGFLPVAGGTTAESIALDQRAIASLQFHFFRVPTPITSVNGVVAATGPGYEFDFIPNTPGNIYGSDGYGQAWVPMISPITTLEEAYGQSTAIVRVRHLGSVPGSESIDLGDYDWPSWPGLDGPTGQISWTASDFGDGEVLFVDLESQTQSLKVNVIVPPGTRNAHLLEMPSAFTPSDLGSMLSLALVTQPDFASVSSYEDLVLGTPMPPNTDLTQMTDDAVMLFGGVD